MTELLQLLERPDIQGWHHLYRKPKFHVVGVWGLGKSHLPLVSPTMPWLIICGGIYLNVDIHICIPYLSIYLSSTYLSYWGPLKSTEKPNETQREINLSPPSNCGMELGGRKKLTIKKKNSESKKGQSVTAPPSLAAPFIFSQGRELASIEHYLALGGFHMGSHWIPILGLWDRCHCLFSTEEKTGNQRG